MVKQLCTIDEFAKVLYDQVLEQENRPTHPSELLRRLIIRVEGFNLIGISKKRIVCTAMNIFRDTNPELAVAIDDLEPMIEVMVNLLNTHIKKRCWRR